MMIGIVSYACCSTSVLVYRAVVMKRALLPGSLPNAKRRARSDSEDDTTTDEWLSEGYVYHAVCACGSCCDWCCDARVLHWRRKTRRLFVMLARNCCKMVCWPLLYSRQVGEHHDVVRL